MPTQHPNIFARKLFEKKRGAILTPTQKLLERKANALGINLEGLTSKNDESSVGEQYEALEHHVLSCAARAYGLKVKVWLATRENILKEAIKETCLQPGSFKRSGFAY